MKRTWYVQVFHVKDFPGEFTLLKVTDCAGFRDLFAKVADYMAGIGIPSGYGICRIKSVNERSGIVRILPGCEKVANRFKEEQYTEI